MKAKRITVKKGEQVEIHIRAASGAFTVFATGPGTISLVVSVKKHAPGANQATGFALESCPVTRLWLWVGSVPDEIVSRCHERARWVYTSYF
jgi:hypothetical protein